MAGVPFSSVKDSGDMRSSRDSVTNQTPSGRTCLGASVFSLSLSDRFPGQLCASLLLQTMPIFCLRGPDIPSPSHFYRQSRERSLSFLPWVDERTVCFATEAEENRNPGLVRAVYCALCPECVCMLTVSFWPGFFFPFPFSCMDSCVDLQDIFFYWGFFLYL